MRQCVLNCGQASPGPPSWVGIDIGAQSQYAPGLAKLTALAVHSMARDTASCERRAWKRHGRPEESECGF